MRMLFAMLTGLSLVACSHPEQRAEDEPRRIVSLDYCADQYVLKFAKREDILALSPDATKAFSYMKRQAVRLPTVRPRTADVLVLRPNLVVRSYGGGQGIEKALQQSGIPLLQIGYPETVGDIRAETLRMGSALGAPVKARDVVAEMDARLNALAKQAKPGRKVLYMTPTGVTAGEGTLVHEMLLAAGFKNFQDRPGWNPIPVERLAYEQPDLIAAAFFESTAGQIDNWSAARHPVVQTQLHELPVVALQGAWTSCGGWFLLDAIEALANARQATS